MAATDEERIPLLQDDRQHENEISSHAAERTSFNNKEREQNAAFDPKERRRLRIVVIEPLLILFVLASSPINAMVPQYRYLRVARSMGINITLNDQNSSCDINPNDTYYTNREKAQSEAANWNIYISISDFIISFFSAFIFSSLSDKYGRKPFLLLPCLGTMTAALLNMVIVFYELPLYWFFFTSVQYLFGGLHTFLAACFTYMVDTIQKDKLSFRITILDALLLSSNGVSNLATGYIIKELGYFWPYFIIIGIQVVALFYAFCFVPESVTHANHKNKGSSLQQILKGFKLVTSGHQYSIILILISFFLGEMVSGVSILPLFEMNVPLCWGSVMMGYFDMVAMLTRCIAMVIASVLLRRIMSDEGQVIVSKLSFIAEYIFLAFVANSTMMYFVPVVGCILYLYLPMYRSILSKKVRPDEQGSIFALMTCISTITTMLGSLVSNQIYAATLFIMEGFAFLMTALCAVLSLAVFLVYVLKFRNPGMKIENED